MGVHPAARVVISWRAPGRINLIGEHTDYNDGFALPLAIEQGCTATVGTAATGELRIVSAQRDGVVTTSLSQLRSGAVRGWAAYPVGVIWALDERRVLPTDLGGLDVHLDSDVPDGAGLSSSAALICALAAAVNDLLELGLSQQDLVTLTHRTENDYVGAPTGGMDQMAALLCRRDSVLLCDMRAWAAEPVPFELAGAGLALVVVDTKARHRHADGEYAERRASCEKAASLLDVAALRDIGPDGLDAALARLPEGVLRRRTRHVVTENDRVLRTASLLRAGRIRDIGPLLTASHASMRDDYEITVPEVDTAVDALLRAGALGARMTGGGFGGCVIGLIDAGNVDAARDAVEQAYRERGFPAAGVSTERAGPGAHRL
jgi:galactokinase